MNPLFSFFLVSNNETMFYWDSQVCWRNVLHYVAMELFRIDWHNQCCHGLNCKSKTFNCNLWQLSNKRKSSGKYFYLQMYLDLFFNVSPQIFRYPCSEKIIWNYGCQDSQTRRTPHPCELLLINNEEVSSIDGFFLSNFHVMATKILKIKICPNFCAFFALHDFIHNEIQS